MEACDHKHPKQSSSAHNSPDALGSERAASPLASQVSSPTSPGSGEGPALCPAPFLSSGRHSLLHPVMALCLTCSFCRKDSKVSLPKVPKKSSFHPNTSLHFLLPWMKHFLSWTFAMLEAGQGTSLAMWWLKLCASSTGGAVSISIRKLGSHVPRGSVKTGQSFSGSVKPSGTLHPLQACPGHSQGPALKTTCKPPPGHTPIPRMPHDWPVSWMVCELA